MLLASPNGAQSLDGQSRAARGGGIEIHGVCGAVAFAAALRLRLGQNLGGGDQERGREDGDHKKGSRRMLSSNSKVVTTACTPVVGAFVERSGHVERLAGGGI